MDDEKIIKKIVDISDNINIPSKLKPENILTTIEATNSKKKKSNLVVMKRVMAACACVAVLVGVGIWHKVSESSLASVENAVAVMETSLLRSNIIPDNKPLGNITHYNQVFTRLNALATDYVYLYAEKVFFEEAVPESYKNGFDGVPCAATGTGAFSTTNVVTQGIDEADIVKTDGRYIYYGYTDYHVIYVYEATGDTTKMINKIEVADMGGFSDFYLDNNRLVVIGSSYREKVYSNVVVYDVTNPATISQLDSYSQEGHNITTRKIDNILYMITEKNINLSDMNKNQPKTFIPEINGELISPSDIYIYAECRENSCYIVSCVDLDNNLEQLDRVCVYGQSASVYMGNESIYMYSSNYYNNEQEIYRIPYQKGDLEPIIKGKVLGNILDTFAINEYNGYLRVITTSNNGNNVWILDDTMTIVGSIEGLAKDERVYSARFMGDIGYFVTFRQVDPLFCVDLSNPTKPVLKSALKIPGFSEYLHPYSKGKMLGIGMSDAQGNIKFSMFDTTDMYDIKEEAVRILEDYKYSPALYDYKTIMIDADKNIFGVGLYGIDGHYYNVYTYSNGEFVEIISHKLNYANIEATRGVFIDNYVYILENDVITSYSLQ